MNYAFLSGMICAGCLVAGLFFLKFWHRTRDALFVFFCAAFWILALERVVLVYFQNNNDFRPVVYLMRVVACGFITVGIGLKNRNTPRAPPASPS